MVHHPPRKPYRFRPVRSPVKRPLSDATRKVAVVIVQEEILDLLDLSRPQGQTTITGK